MTAPNSARRARRRLFVLLALLVGGLVAAGLAELLLVHAYPIYGQLLRPDPELLFCPRPGGRRIQRLPAGDGGHGVRIAFDADGYRGPGLDPSHARPRVVVLGDSFVMGAFSPVEETFAVRLGEACAARGRPVEVVNAGVVGWGPDQAVLRLRREAATLRPEAAVLCFFAGNDFGDPIRNKLVGFTPDGSFSRRGHELPASLTTVFERHPAVWHLGRALGDLVRPAPAGAGGPIPLADLVELRRLELESYLRNPITSDLFGDTYDADVWLEPASPGSDLKRRLAAAILTWFRTTCAEHGIRPLVVAIPTDQEVCERPYGPIDPTRWPRYRRGASSALASEAAAAAGLPCVDLFPTLRAATEPVYLEVDGHWNARGQALAAEAVVDRLLEALPAEPRR